LPEDRQAAQATRAWEAVRQQEEDAGERASGSGLQFRQALSSARGGGAHVLQLMGCSAIVACLGGLALVLPLSLLVNGAAGSQAAAGFRSDGVSPRATSMLAWSTSAVEKDSFFFWVFWWWHGVLQRLYTFGAFFVFACQWSRSSVRGLLCRWAPVALAAVVTLAIQFAFVLMASRSALEYSPGMRVADVSLRVAIWLVVTVPCFAWSAPENMWRRALWPSAKWAVGSSLLYMAVSQATMVYWSLRTRSLTVLLLFAVMALKLLKALLTHVFLLTLASLPRSTRQLEIIMLVGINLAILTGYEVLLFSSESLVSVAVSQAASTLSEVCTHLNYLECRTDVERWRQLGGLLCTSLRQLAGVLCTSLCCKAAAHPGRTPEDVVAVDDQPSGASTGDAPPAEVAPAKSSEASETELDEAAPRKHAASSATSPASEAEPAAATGAMEAAHAPQGPRSLGRPGPPKPPCELLPAWMEDAAHGSAADGGPESTERHFLFASLVYVSNAAEMYTQVLTLWFCLFCKVSEVSGLPRPMSRNWPRLLAVVAISLAFEVLGDLATVVLAQRRYARTGRSLPSLRSVREKLGASAIVQMVCLGLLVVVTLLGKMVISMCPVPGEEGELHAIAVCSPS